MDEGKNAKKDFAHDLSDQRALIVDDNMMMTTMTQDMLKKLGFKEVDVARSGSEGLARIQEAKDEGATYDVVFLDWHMPDMSGYEVLRQCREDRALHKMAIIMVTAENQKRSISEAMKTGATAYTIKPASREDLENAVDTVMRWRSGMSGHKTEL